jgi:SAM-dependent methyltransferase
MIEQRELLSLMKDYLAGSDHPDLQVYRSSLSGGELREIWHWRTQEFCRLGGFQGKRILEVGCGFGWDAVGLSKVGNNEVVASDILPSMIDGMSGCLEAMAAKGETINVSPLQGDICKLDLDNESFDGIFSTEAIEHVHDLGLMFDRCFSLLKPGGTMVLVNDSNKFNPEARAHSWDEWDDRDNSWEHVEWLKKEVRPVEHANAKPYGVMREEYIRSIDTGLSDEDVAKLREATAGLIYPDLDAAVAAYKKDGTLPVRDEYRWCRNPETGEYSERLLDPFELVDMLKARGFKVELRHLFRKFPFRLLNSNGIRFVQEKLFNKRAHFVIVASKPA